MKEYIEREAAVKAAQEGADEWDGGFNRNRDTYIECAIDKIPAADVVEVVRCKKCLYFYGGPMKCCMNHVGVVLTDENGFCHHAKRREDEGGDD